MQSLYKSLFIRNNIINATQAILSGILGYTFHFFASRRLSIGQYGELQALFSFFSILTFVAMSAVNYIVVKYGSVFAAYKDYRATEEFINQFKEKIKWPTWILTALIFLISPFIAKYLGISNYWSVVFFMLAALAGVWGSIFRDSLQAWKNFISVAYLNVLANGIKLISAFIFAIFFPSVAGIALSMFIANLLWCNISRITQKNNFAVSVGTAPAESRRISWKEKYFSNYNFLAHLKLILMFSVAIALVSNMDVIIVKKITSPDLAGYYAALVVLGKVVFWINFAVVGVMLPEAFQSSYCKKGISEKKYIGAYLLILSAGLFLCLGYYFFPLQIVETLFGERYQVVSDNLVLFGFFALALSLLNFESHINFSSGSKSAIYVLSAVVIAEVLLISRFSGTISSIALCINIALWVGYFLVFLINWRQRHCENHYA